ncbi:FAD/NAD(P)-binding protein [Zeaxanthinibacter enoshimensis]|uniref:FAD/NAD(P)-binding protein n=1 Tax=Zeaxanthinibacter enoshimensis TaxID=392009 RepID=UPI003566B213
MSRSIKVGVIGSGATALFFLKHVSDRLEVFRDTILEITIFEKEDKMAMGMPYSPRTTDIYNLANISSDEIPELPETFGNWLRNQDSDTLKALNIKDRDIDDSEVYSRVALGHYLHAQYTSLVNKLKSGGVAVRELNNTKVADVVYDKPCTPVKVIDERGKKYDFSKVVIATGHAWTEGDQPDNGYYASPWPIQKLFPPGGSFHNFTIGTLGASLSAFDVVTSLAHRHGSFTENNGELKFTLADGAADFRIHMHSAEGWLPHLQYLQEKPMREIYRHTDREKLLSLRDEDGFIRLETYFREICKPALREALRKDRKNTDINILEQPGFGIEDFVDLMSGEHEYQEAFEGMKHELVQAERSLESDQPAHWKETLDDLMYSLNFHAEMLPAEDHILLHKKVMPFLLNVISALPLSSARILLALYKAGCIEMVTGKVEIPGDCGKGDKTKVIVEKENGEKEEITYPLFINCAGQDLVELEEFPFRALAEEGQIRKARARFKEYSETHHKENESLSDNIFREGEEQYYYIGGIDIDPSYRVINLKGEAVDAICDIAFSHALGVRPYSYGLQACNATSKIMVANWLDQMQNEPSGAGGNSQITELYDETEKL